MVKSTRFVMGLCLLAVSATAIGCAQEGDSPGEPRPDDITQVRGALGSKSQFGTVFNAGMVTRFWDILNPSGIDPTQVTGLAACDAKALYVIMPDVNGPFSLYYSKDEGLSFTKVVWSGTSTPAAAKSERIACDDGRLYTLDCAGVGGCSKAVFVAGRASGNLVGSWADTGAAMANLVDRIQGGDGTLYGVKFSTSGGLNTLYKASTHNSQPSAWTQVSGVGSATVTGAGNTGVTDRVAWPRRAFSLETNGTVSYNDTILAGQNSWSFFDTGTERFSMLSAAGPNLLYGFETVNGHHLVQLTVDEADCGDGQDNDADGKVDGEDEACTQTKAAAFCALSTSLDGTYCVDRYQGTGMFLGQTPNQNAGVIRCTNHAVAPVNTGDPATVKVGACLRVGTRSDRLLTQAELAAPNPAGIGRWCNKYFSSGDWDFQFGSVTSNPCTVTSGGTIVRAGLYSTTGDNNVYVSCTDGQSAISGAAGNAPLTAAKNAVTHNLNRCLFTVTATSLPVFNQPFPLALQGGASEFDHGYASVEISLPQFGNGETGTSPGIDRFGLRQPDREQAYDLGLTEGVPLFAMANGTVLTPNGSRERDVTLSNIFCPTDYQGEIYVKHYIGDGSTTTAQNYQESFVAYYAHVRRSLVVPGQTVRRGQILGYVGRTGCAGGPHLHIGVFRTSNVNAHKPSPNFNFGWHLTFNAESDPSFGSGNTMENSNAIDPLGWGNFSAFDPWGYQWRNQAFLNFTGVGGWSVNLFNANQAFRYP